MQNISTAPLDGTPVDIFFKVAGKLIRSRSKWLPEGRWNGMCKGQSPEGWEPAGAAKVVDPFS